MNEADLQELIDKAVAGRLSREEEQRWNALLVERPELEDEIALGEALQALPKPPAVASNFSALVMQEIRRGETTERKKPRFPLAEAGPAFGDGRGRVWNRLYGAASA
jgi:hypothetical protein